MGVTVVIPMLTEVVIKHTVMGDIMDHLGFSLHTLTQEALVQPALSQIRRPLLIMSQIKCLLLIMSQIKCQLVIRRHF